MNPRFAQKVARLVVVPRSDGSFHVTDPLGGGIHTVRYVDGAAYCTCIATIMGNGDCSHRHAVHHYISKQQKATA